MVNEAKKTISANLEKLCEKGEGYVNLDEVEGIPRNELHLLVAKAIAEDNLRDVNEISDPVNPRKGVYSLVVKRVLDFILALVAFLVTLPFNIVFGILTFFDVGRPIFYHETRIGINGKPFQIYKFRNMTNDTDESGVLLPAAQRVTKFGRIMRKYSFDELLNFWFILIGKMSFIGPRPLHKEYLSRYSERHMHRLDVRPGLECPATDGNFAMTWTDQFETDVNYVENVSFVTDVKKVIALFRMVFDSESNSVRSGAVKGGFMGYDKNGNSINSRKVPVVYANKAVKAFEESLASCSKSLE